MNSLTQKRCTKCGEWKNKSEFYMDKLRKDGLFPWCKECQRENVREYKNKNPQKVKEMQKASSIKNSEKIRAYKKIWFSNNREKAYENTRKYNKLHPDKRRETVHKYIDNNIQKVRGKLKEWFQNNPEKRAEYNNARRAKVNGNGGRYTANDWKALREKYGNICIVPGCDRTDLTADHVIPISKGGSNGIENIQPLCRHHNFTKHDKIIDYR